MSSLPTVSVIIPCYNYGAYIEEAINSVLNQKYSNWELVVVDDGSSDNTAEVVAKLCIHDTRIRYIYQSNQGLSAARNTGLRETTGVYIQLLDADDYLAPDKLDLQVQFLQENNSVDLVFSDTYFFDNANSNRDISTFEQYTPKIAQISGKGLEILLHLSVDNMFLPGAPLFRRKMAQSVGEFKEGLSALEDWHYWYRGLLAGNTYQHDGRKEVALLSRHHGENMSSSQLRMWKNWVLARESVLELIQERMKKCQVGMDWLQPVLQKNQNLLKQEKARYHLLYGKPTIGIYNMLMYSLFSGKWYDTLYEGAYLLKERMKLQLKKIKNKYR